ncbi:MAG TPA: hypothetical protein VFX61_03800, partial [Micromonosporaceae bacterium]|nr:hypothetical protein [Micromonosporaceae bacterium]
MDLREQLIDFIRTHIALGSARYELIIDSCVEYLKGAAEEDEIRRLADQVADVLFAEFLADQATWPAVTDNDRLTTAFRELDVAGIVARENFACCQNCGHAEITAEIKDDETRRGYVFYHGQDAERGANGDGIYLAYGGQDPTAVADETVRVLRSHGLAPVWSGSAGQRIQVPMRWHQRRAGRLAAHPGTIQDADFTVELEIVGDWPRHYGPAPGRASAKRLASLHLPWLPSGVRVRLSADGRQLEAYRDWDRLIGTVPDSTGVEFRVDRRDAWFLVAWLRGDEPLPYPQTVGEPELLEVTYQHSAGAAVSPVPMSLAESVSVLRHMPVWADGWATYTGRSGVIVQHIWEPGPKLWLESPDAATRVSRGRYVTLAEAEQVITILAREDRVAIGDLGE